MATVNMNCVEFYNPNPKPALKASHAQLTKSLLNKPRLPLQPSRSPSAMLAGDVQDNDSLDDSLPSLEELGHLLTDATTLNSAYVPGNTQREPLIIEDDSDDESNDEAEGRTASSDHLAIIKDQDASECDLTPQDAASTPSSLFGPSTPRDAAYLNVSCFSKDGQQCLSFAELDSTFPVHVRQSSPSCSELAETTGHDRIHQGVEKAIVDEMSLLNYAVDQARGSPPLSAAHSQYNQIKQKSQNNTDVRGTSSEERLWEKTIEQQHCQQKVQEDEDKDDMEATSSDNNGQVSYCQQIMTTVQHEQVEDETVVVTPLSQDRQHSVNPFQKDNEDNDNEDSEDDEDGDVQPPMRRKRPCREFDSTETAMRKKVHTRSSTTAQAQTCSTRSSTVSQTAPDDAESMLGADYEEYPLQGFLKCVRI
ncbi:hypothetical protein GMDG_04683 [Pseudogymnoascus destructans 20631-21]|uniref:Uncharacterized protein n=1 Tax=Pseudogymnoascus destructans (strain ATCC MYA-4855 / 20631-21) TaxID=658429 RepID=L8GBP1_PSED2|nr:hypothetical protein GMDG_04683 [Pseudogymnoascus destructans 20631-21]